WLLLAAAHRRLRLIAITQNLESNELVDVTGRQGSLVELHPKLLHADGGNVNHRSISAVGRPRWSVSAWKTSPTGPPVHETDAAPGDGSGQDANCTDPLATISTVFWSAPSYELSIT